jgi:tungstate transport system substrate-binding protein
MNRNRTAIVVATFIVASALGSIYILQSQARLRTMKLVISTTTSLYDTGVLDHLEEAFEAEHNVDLNLISSGTGLAIAYAERGDADMIIVHAPSKELSFLESGVGVNRKTIAYNFFAIIGPQDDPAGIRGMSPSEALKVLVETGSEGDSAWVSRGDDSGTHTKEKVLWSMAGFNASHLRDTGWYHEAGAGMGKTLQIAEEFGAYTLTDVGTYLKYRNEGLISLEALVEAGEELLNVYSAIAVNPEGDGDPNFIDATTFIEYLVSEEGQRIFQTYGVDEYGEVLFNPIVELMETRFDPVTADWVEGVAYFNGSECPVVFRTDDTSLYD